MANNDSTVRSAQEAVQDIQRDLWNLNRELTRFHQEPHEYDIRLDEFNALRTMIHESWDEAFIKAAKRIEPPGTISHPVYQTTRSAEIIPNARAYATMILTIIKDGNTGSRLWAESEVVRLFQAAMGELPEANPHDEYIGKEN